MERVYTLEISTESESSPISVCSENACERVILIMSLHDAVPHSTPCQTPNAKRHLILESSERSVVYSDLEHSHGRKQCSSTHPYHATPTVAQ